MMIYERGVLYAIDLSREFTQVVPTHPAVFEEVGLGNVDPLAAAMGQPQKDILRRLTAGRRCFGARVQDQIVAYGWVSQTDECIGEQNREIRLPPGEAYIWDCATLDQYRNQKLYSALLSHIVAVLRKEGMRRIWVGTSAENKPSQRGFVNAGFQPVLSLIAGRFLNLRFSLMLGQSSVLHTFVADARRALIAPDERAWGAFVFAWSQPRTPRACAELEA